MGRDVRDELSESPATYAALLGNAGFAVEGERNLGEFCLAIARQMQEERAAGGAPPLGQHMLMGPATRARIGNVMRTIESATITPVMMIARKRA